MQSYHELFRLSCCTVTMLLVTCRSSSCLSCEWGSVHFAPDLLHATLAAHRWPCCCELLVHSLHLSTPAEEAAVQAGAVVAGVCWAGRVLHLHAREDSAVP